MNKAYVLYNLKKAKEELDKTINAIEKDPKYDYGEYIVAMTHLYHHINTAWNARDANQKEADECSEENFKAWRQFPAELLLL